MDYAIIICFIVARTTAQMEKEKGVVLVTVGFGTSKIINFYFFMTYNVFFVLTISYRGTFPENSILVSNLAT